MKKIVLGLAAVALLAAGTASAREKVKVEAPEPGGNGGGQPAPGPWTAKDELGCKLVLCMANPDGPSAVAECAEAMHERARLIAKGKPIPKCPGYNTADNSGGDTGGGGSRDDNTRTQQN